MLSTHMLSQKRQFLLILLNTTLKFSFTKHNSEIYWYFNNYLCYVSACCLVTRKRSSFLNSLYASLKNQFWYLNNFVCYVIIGHGLSLLNKFPVMFICRCSVARFRIETGSFKGWQIYNFMKEGCEEWIPRVNRM